MENKYKYYVTLCAAVLGLSVATFNQVDAASNRVLTTETSLESRVAIAERPQESPQVRAVNLGGAWSVDTFTHIEESPLFKDLAAMTEPLARKFSFSMSMTDESEIIGADGATQPGGGGTYVDATKLAKGSSFLVTNIGFWKGESVDLKVTIIDYDQGNDRRHLHLMFGPYFFAGYNPLQEGAQEINPGVFLNVSYQTVLSGTDTPLEVSGVLPYFNLSPMSVVGSSSNQFKEIYAYHGVDSSVVHQDSQFITGGFDLSSWVDYKTALPGGGLVSADSPLRKADLVYEDMHTREVYYGNSHDILPHGFTMAPRAQVPIALPEPIVTGNDYATTPKMQYDINQFIPIEPVTHAFQNFFVDLPMDKVLQPVDLADVVVTTDRGYTLTAADYAVSKTTRADGGETISVEVLEDFRERGAGSLQGMEFYGRYLNVNVPVALDGNADLSGYLSADKKLIRVPLTSTTRIDDHFYRSIDSLEPGYAEANNAGKLTITHVDEQDRQLIPDESLEGVLGEVWGESYTENGGYLKDKIYLGTEEVDTIEIKSFDNPYKVTFLDKRFAFDMSAVSPTDSRGATVKQDETLNYTLDIGSSAKQSFVTPNVNNYQTATVTLVDYDDGLLEKPSGAELQLADGTVVGTASYDEATKAYSFTDIQPQVAWDTDLVLAFSAKIKPTATVGETVRMKSTVELTFDADALSFTGDTAPLDTEIVKAQLEFQSHPSDVSFGTIKRATFGGVKMYPVKSMSNDLVVRDERPAGSGNGWRMSAKLLTDFTTTIDGTDYTLPNILKYVDPAKGKLELTKGEKVLVYNQYTSGEALTNISKDWKDKSEGLILELFSGNAKDKEYTATLQWELEDAY